MLKYIFAKSCIIKIHFVYIFTKIYLSYIPMPSKYIFVKISRICRSYIIFYFHGIFFLKNSNAERIFLAIQTVKKILSHKTFTHSTCQVNFNFPTLLHCNCLTRVPTGVNYTLGTRAATLKFLTGNKSPRILAVSDQKSTWAISRRKGSARTRGEAGENKCVYCTQEYFLRWWDTRS